LETINDLHTEIHSRLAAAGIEIAFPQLDLHVRSGWKAVQVPPDTSCCRVGATGTCGG
jgi:small-conductance mechanosensitive channel